MDTVHECDRQTDGRTDRITIANTVQRIAMLWHIASHGKNGGIFAAFKKSMTESRSEVIDFGTNRKHIIR